MSGTLANFLFDLATRASADGANGRTLRLRVRREDLIQHLDLTPAALEVEFERLVARRTISLGPENTVTVLDRAALAGLRDEERAPRTPAGALQEVLADERFRAAPRTSMLLAYLVEKALGNEMESLDHTRVAVEAFGDPPGADPHTLTPLPELVEQLREMLDTYYASGHVHDFVIRVVPGTCRVLIQSQPPRRRASGTAADAAADATPPTPDGTEETDAG